MITVILSIIGMGGSVIGIYLYLEDRILQKNRKEWKEFEASRQAPRMTA